MAFTTSGQEMEWAYSCSPGDHTGHYFCWSVLSELKIWFDCACMLMWVSYWAAAIVGRRVAVCMDKSSHCRPVDDSKLLTKNHMMLNPDNQESCRTLPVACATGTSSELTSPKVPVADVQRSITGSLQTNTSLQPLLRPGPDMSCQSPWRHLMSTVWPRAFVVCWQTTA